MLLSVKTRQKYLKELGFYNGAIDGKVGPKTKKAYKDLQKTYFTKTSRPKDRNGIYGKDTDILLRSAYNCKDAKHFKLEEFVCKCKKDCTGYPVELSKLLIDNLDKLREHYGKSITIKSGERCNKHNKAVGGSSTSKHKKGKASDIYFTKCSTKNGRIEVVNYWTKILGQYHAYCNGYRVRGGKVSYPNTPNMGTSVHVEVK